MVTPILKKLLFTTRLILVFITSSLLSCNTLKSHTRSSLGYDLSKPDRRWILPDTLREISGINLLDTVNLACVQDENGILFTYNLVSNKISRQYTFNIDGDYEELCRVENSLFILRSDGTLFEIENFDSPQFKVIIYPTGIPADNNEGLCYDEKNDRLLLACKSRLGKGVEFKDKRAIYGFDLKTKKLSLQPVYEFDVAEIKNYAIAHNLKIRTRSKKGGKIEEPLIRFATSAIALHPVEKKLYLLSATDHLLFVFDTAGELLSMDVLDPVLFNKSEGISFFANGDMLISNEAQSKKPTLLRFNYKGQP